MSILQDIVRAIGSEPLTRAAEACFMRALLDRDEDHPSITNLLQHLVVVDLALLEKIVRSELRDSHPSLVRRLIVHSYNESASGRGRGAVRTIANYARMAAALPVSPGSSTLLLTDGQSAALEKLDALLEIYLSQAGTPAPVRMRLSPMVIGGSGTGKTFLSSLLAQRHGLGMFRTSAAEWMVEGSKAAEPTLTLIRKSIDQHPEGLVLHIDEIDKLQGQESWTMAQRGEIYCCACDRMVAGAGWTEKHRQALRDRVFVVATATFQEIWTHRVNRHRGFTAPELSAVNIEEEIRASRVIPDELLFRWSPLIAISPYTASDFQKIAAQLQISPQFLDPEEAAKSNLNFRAIEAALSEQALVAHQARRRAALAHFQS